VKESLQQKKKETEEKGRKNEITEREGRKIRS
jgi:hypothetical protein